MYDFTLVNPYKVSMTKPSQQVFVLWILNVHAIPSIEHDDTRGSRRSPFVAACVPYK